MDWNANENYKYLPKVWNSKKNRNKVKRISLVNKKVAKVIIYY